MNRFAWVLAAAGVGLAACAPAGDADPERAATGALIANRNVDVLFMIDNSSGMRLAQQNLLSNFPTFIDGLQNLPEGLPNIHMAVVSSDMGAGDGSIAGCDSHGGDNGVFQFTPLSTCPAGTLSPGATFISNVGGAANYTGNMSDVFSCIAAVGENGCGFEHQFASVLRALGADGQPAPAENQGFLRRDALLAVVMVTDEDDCSARAGINLYDTSSNMTLMSQFGPPANYRCNEFGHVCNGVRPPRQAPTFSVSDTVTLQNCASSECDGALTPVAEFVARIKALKANPASEILLAAIAGPPAPYRVHWKSPSTSDTTCGQSLCPWPEISHSCTSADTSFADPGVRVAQAVAAFGQNGLAFSICDASFGPTMQAVATRIGTLLAAGGGSGGVSGSIPTCAAPGGAGGASAGGAGGAVDGGTGGAGGTTAVSPSTGAGGSADEGNLPLPGRDGCSCQSGGAALNGGSVAGVLIALLARRRHRASARSRRG